MESKIFFSSVANKVIRSEFSLCNMNKSLWEPGVPVGEGVCDVGLPLALTFAVDIRSLFFFFPSSFPALNHCKEFKNLVQEPRHFIIGHSPAEGVVPSRLFLNQKM